MDDSHHFVFLIDQVPVRFYHGFADDPMARTLRQQEAEAQQLELALGDEATGLIFRFAIEANATGRVERVVFLALQGDRARRCAAGQCHSDMPVAQGAATVQLRLIANDGYEGPPTRRAANSAMTPMSRAHRKPAA